MTVLVGLAPGERGLAPLQLKAVLARSSGDDLVLATIVPAPWPPDPNRQDAEYLAYIKQAARKSGHRGRFDFAPPVVGGGSSAAAPRGGSGALGGVAEPSVDLLGLLDQVGGVSTSEASDRYPPQAGAAPGAGAFGPAGVAAEESGGDAG